MNKQQLASKIWESANKMRSKIEANEYKDYILGFIFLKENDFTDNDIKAPAVDVVTLVTPKQDILTFFWKMPLIIMPF